MEFSESFESLFNLNRKFGPSQNSTENSGLGGKGSQF